MTVALVCNILSGVCGTEETFIFVVYFHHKNTNLDLRTSSGCLEMTLFVKWTFVVLTLSKTLEFFSNCLVL